MKTFHLPDLGEGLQEAQVVTWHVGPGDHVVADQPLLAVETDKAVVDIPSPRAGTIAEVCAREGDLLATGAPLLRFTEGSEETLGSADAGSVVGEVPTGSETLLERPEPLAGKEAGIKATPAVRAMARRLDVDLSVVTPSGPDGTITRADVERVARIFAEVGPLEPLRGVRRAMARYMSQARDEVMHALVTQDADIHRWPTDSDPMVRLLHALEAAVTAEPTLNGWYDSHTPGRRLLQQIDVGVAVDSPAGLLVPVLKDLGQYRDDPAALRLALDELLRGARERTLTQAQLRGATITLSNFGSLAGRYALPVVVPPTVAIVAAGRIRDAAVAWQGQVVVHPVLPISLAFDHRAVTGGEAARFLAAFIEALQAAH